MARLWGYRAARLRAINNRTGPMSLIKQRARIMQHWAEGIDTMLDDGKVMALPKRKIVA